MGSGALNTRLVATAVHNNHQQIDSPSINPYHTRTRHPPFLPKK
jgi:hypothetical protein